MNHPEVGRSRWDEADRLAALKRYGVLDTTPEAAFDDLANLAARLCEAPMAAVSLVDAERQWFKAEVGLGVSETPRPTSFCAHAMVSDRPMVVTDACLDARFADNPLVTGAPNIRFYAGYPLKTPEGVPLGALCVLDRRARPEGLTELQALAMQTLADQVMTQLELRRALLDRDRSEKTARLAIEASAYVGAWDWDIATDRVVADERFARMYGVDPVAAREGAPIAVFRASVHPDDLVRRDADIQRALDGEGLFVSEYRLVVDGRVRWMLARGRVEYDRSGAAVRLPGVAVDITERKQTETDLAETARALSASEARFRILADAMPQMVWSTRPDGFHDYYNARWYEFTGVPVGSTDGQGWSDIFHPDDQQRAWTTWRHSLETGDPYEIEYRLKHHSGAYRWTLGRAVAIHDEEGRITRWFGTCTDIDELKRLEQGRELVSQELSHRIKNIFAVVSALVALSARQYPEAKAFSASLRTRIAALARAHEFVRPHTETSQPTVGATTLHTFLADLFKAYADDVGLARVIISGDDAVFDDQAATSVALLFHELATNAAKYGALSQKEGSVLLHTAQDGDRFVLTWSERDGPRIDGPPSRSGFGSSLATLSVEGQLGGKLQREWNAAGLKVIVDLPATALSRRRAAVSGRI
ncbi:MAG: PAS domain-containing protein [Candidatus Brevundimonas colombiensis]|uniref:histidine kinase n=1 Tax=Candidatus Brevundimonas colombiensis TaxID=3121376 RepID=A0AAJ5WWK9_9CAUL|nr:PAS domain-containing protein [Brevundimonas sp.]WEK38551.1 MAG: PAS domain-containing protein [Brevundimonas sp.]